MDGGRWRARANASSAEVIVETNRREASTPDQPCALSLLAESLTAGQVAIRSRRLLSRSWCIWVVVALEKSLAPSPGRLGLDPVDWRTTGSGSGIRDSNMSSVVPDAPSSVPRDEGALPHPASRGPSRRGLSRPRHRRRASSAEAPAPRPFHSLLRRALAFNAPSSVPRRRSPENLQPQSYELAPHAAKETRAFTVRVAQPAASWWFSASRLIPRAAQLRSSSRPENPS
jgi:hypothetical protein